MEQIEFFTAKNNSLSCRINGTLLHSGYNPESEAEKNVLSMNVSFLPKYILMPEPCLSYTAPFFRKKFPSAKLCAVRFCNAFNEYNINFDKIINFYDPNKIAALETELSAYFGESGILYCQFAPWNPSARVFQKHSENLWLCIKKLVNISQSVLNTNGFFSKRWIKNTAAFLKYIKKTAVIKRGSSDILITASGMSLASSIYEIKKIREKVFLIAVSSSLKPLLANNIIPDLVISTDGGYWAKAHLSELCRHKEIPIALSAESNCPKTILENNTIIPLFYPDGISARLLSALNVHSVTAERNGTVSGTAASLAMNITSGNIYFCGLDLAPGSGFQHTAPNELEIKNSASDNRLCSLETRQTRSRFSSASLKIYEDWFVSKSNNFSGRFFRLSKNYSYSNRLGKIHDIDFSDLSLNENKPDFPKITAENSSFLHLSEIKEKITKIASTEEFIKECFPIEYLSYERELESDKKAEILKEIKTKNQNFSQKILKTL
ncbi:MAG: DUF115 domain-containing protein [Treponema sp.]|nr:DUF115 domain-containing protein [Treponema sp.]